MKSDTKIRAQFGLKQNEMAMLLGISRGQWSMYESGKRNLPPQATKLLADLLSHLKPEHAAKHQPATNVRTEAYRIELERLIKENQYQTLLLERKIKALKKKQLAAENFSNFAEIVNNRNQESKDSFAKPIVLPRHKKSSVENKHLVQLVSYEIKLELLEAEKKFLHSKIVGSAESSRNSITDSASK